MPAKQPIVNPSDQHLSNVIRDKFAVVPLEAPVGLDKSSIPDTAASIPYLLGIEKFSPKTKPGIAAVLDTGISNLNNMHPDLDGKVIKWFNYKGESNVTTPGADLYDQYGHGTHIAGLIAGKRGRSKKIGGIAPDARLISIKITDEASNLTPVWHIIDALDLVYSYNESISKRKSFIGAKVPVGERISVVNLSFNMFDNMKNTDGVRSHALYRSINKLFQSGVPVVVSGGNCYANFEAHGLGYPAYIEQVIAAGALANESGMLRMIRNAQRIPCDGHFNPDHPFFILTYGQDTYSTGIGHYYSSLNCSSQAAAVITGLILLMGTLKNYRSVNDIKKALHAHAFRIRNRQSPWQRAAAMHADPHYDNQKYICADFNSTLGL